MSSETRAVDVEGSPDSGLHWEHREELGFWGALVRTAKLLALAPTDAFGRMRPEPGLGGPLLFGAVVALAALLLNILGAAIFGSMALIDLPPELNDFLRITVDGHSLEWIPLLLVLATGSLFGMLVATLVFPPIFILGLFLWSAALHLSVLLTAGRKSTSSFRGTFAVAAYSSVAFLVHGIPAIGDLVATIWVVVLQTLGLAIVHRTSRLKALAALLLVPLTLLAVAAVLTLVANGSAG